MFHSDLLVDVEWVHKISHKLEGFNRPHLRKNVFNSRCPVCGDSKKSVKKKRFFIYEVKGNLNVVCHNCGYSRSFFNFMKEIMLTDYEQYKKDQIMSRFSHTRHKKRSHPNTQTEQKSTTELKIEQVKGIIKLTSLPKDHYALKYVLDRGLPENCLGRLYFSESFLETGKSVSSTYDTKYDEPRLIIPFFTEEGKVKAIQGRSFKKNSPLRYITLKVDDDNDKIYGLESIDKDKLVRCVEGPLDSLFIENCVATCDAALTKTEADVYIWDNEPRKKDTIRFMETAIEEGKNIVVWPTSPNKKMDINDMILSGIGVDDLNKVIEKCTYRGLMAKHKLNEWKKI